MSGISEKLSSFHLSADPFADNTPLANLFPGGKRRHILEQVLALIAESSDIIAIVGSSGSGKSTLADFITRQASQNHAVARVRASLLTSPVQLLQEMFKAFVLNFPPNASLADLQDDLDDYLDRLAEQGRRAVLVVDDAHELGDEALSLLVRISLEDNPGNTFRLILLGEQALVDMLDYTCPYRESQPPFQILHLPVFSTEESSHYLRFRLNNVGFRRHEGVPALPFDRRQIHRIHKKGGGLPGPINAAARQLLNSPGGLGASLQKVLPGNPLSGLLDKLPRKLPLNLPGNWGARLPANVRGKYGLAAAATGAILLLTLLLVGGEPGVETAQRPVMLPEVSATTASSGPAPGQNPVAPISQREATVPAAESVSQPAPAPVQQAVQEPVRPVPSTASSAPTPAPASPQASRSVPSDPAATPATSAGALALSAQAGRIQALPADNFTLQLLGSTSLSNVEAFVARHASDAVYWYETTLQNRPWYVVIYGVYPGPGAARAAVAGLPPALRELQPWARNIEDVQRESGAPN